jgi:uncharacterized protein YerC
MARPNSDNSTPTLMVVPAQVRYRHIKLDGLDKPIAALDHLGHTYSFFRVCTDWEEVEKLMSRLSDPHVVTRIKKGWAVWVYEY